LLDADLPADVFVRLDEAALLALPFAPVFGLLVRVAFDLLGARDFDFDFAFF
jgi:hypothetical protein